MFTIYTFNFSVSKPNLTQSGSLFFMLLINKNRLSSQKKIFLSNKILFKVWVSLKSLQYSVLSWIVSAIKVCAIVKVIIEMFYCFQQTNHWTHILCSDPSHYFSGSLWYVLLDLLHHPFQVYFLALFFRWFSLHAFQYLSSHKQGA